MSYTYCPTCGQLLHRVRDTLKRCISCNTFYHPTVATCVVGVVHEGERVLLDRRAYPPGKGQWALLGGYIEPNEPPEQALQREIEEESGLHVEVGRFIGVRTGGPTCTLFYATKVREGLLRPSPESLELAWFTEQALPWQHIAFPRHADILKMWFNEKIWEYDEHRTDG